MIKAIEAGDSHEARRWIEEHMNLAARSYGKDYQRPLEELAREATERLGEYGGRAELRDQIESLVRRARRRARLG